MNTREAAHLLLPGVRMWLIRLDDGGTCYAHNEALEVMEPANG